MDLPGRGRRVPFRAFSPKKKADQVTGRLVVRRLPNLNPCRGQDSLFDTWRFQASFTTSALETVTANKTHHGHAIIEQVHADLEHSALAQLPSGEFTANADWLVLAVIALNLIRTAATICRTLITAPVRITTFARQVTLHLPQNWP